MEATGVTSTDIGKFLDRAIVMKDRVSQASKETFIEEDASRDISPGVDAYVRLGPRSQPAPGNEAFWVDEKYGYQNSLSCSDQTTRRTNQTPCFY